MEKLQLRGVLTKRHGGVSSLQYTAGENLALQFRRGRYSKGK